MSTIPDLQVSSSIKSHGEALWGFNSVIWEFSSPMRKEKIKKYLFYIISETELVQPEVLDPENQDDCKEQFITKCQE